jgi:HTH-type transcriptional regulator / antitoxin HipB
METTTIYIITHQYMPGLVKIGMTSFKDASKRIAELSSATGVPGSFDLSYQVVTEKNEYIESQVHHRLKKDRVKGTEFFKVGLNEAIRVVNETVENSKKKLEEVLKEEVHRREAIVVNSVEEIGKQVRETRKCSPKTQLGVAETCGVGHRFLRELENGKETVQMGKVFDVLNAMGIKVYITI